MAPSQTQNPSDLTFAKTVSESYIGPHASTAEKELKRLDDMHRGFLDYLDGRLSLAPLEESNPQAILELGCGTGLWAIQAAHQFPNARVVAVDLQPIPSFRESPPNIEMHLLNITDSLPFQEESFDIIHARFLFMHIPDAIEVMTRIIRFLKPGGWLVIEDFDGYFIGAGPATARLMEVVNGVRRSRGITIGPITYDKNFLAMGLFGEVHAKRIPLCISEQSDNVKLNRLGAIFRESYLRAMEVMADIGTPGFTQEVLKKCVEELNDLQHVTTGTVTFIWAQKKMS